MTTEKSPGDVGYLAPHAPRHLVLDQASQRKRIMIVGDIHGEALMLWVL